MRDTLLNWPLQCCPASVSYCSALLGVIFELASSKCDGQSVILCEERDGEIQQLPSGRTWRSGLPIQVGSTTVEWESTFQVGTCAFLRNNSLDITLLYVPSLSLQSHCGVYTGN